jgi:aspartate carbamoyltransferase catalytic subunit
MGAADEDSLTESSETWRGSNLVTVKQITPKGLRMLMEVAAEMKSLVRLHGGDDRLKHMLVANVFYEASTRTLCSFQSAMLRLGGE